MTDVIAAIVEFPTVLFVIVIVLALAGLGVVIAKWPRGEPAASTDLVGRTCVIRADDTGATRAEVTDAEGETRLIPIRPAAEVRQDGGQLRSGSSALIYDYDNTGGFFMVAPLAKKTEPSE